MAQPLRQFLLCFSLLLAPASARADSAATLKAQGDAAFTARRYTEAIAAYDQAYEAGGNAAVLYNKARAHEALEQFPEALATIERFDKEAPPEVRAKVSGLSTLISSIRSQVSTIVVQANVQGARVTVRGIAVGETATGPLRVQVNRGRARIVVEKEGYAPFVQEADLPGDSTTIVTALLDPKSASALVRIRSSPARAAVTVDGRAVGATPVELNLTPKAHLVELERDGYERLTTTIVVEADKPRTLELSLAESRSILTRWWFWTAVGGALVAGAAITFVVVQEKDVPPGSIAPGTVSAPLWVLGR